MYAGRTPSGGSDRPGRGPGRPPPPAPAFAASEGHMEAETLELTLQPESVTEVDDAAGRWEHERGRASAHGTQVAVYASTTHVGSPGTAAPGDRTFTLTLFFLGGTPPETITLHGAHDAGSHRDSGTVSATSAGHAGRLGKGFTRTDDVVIID